MIASLTVLAEIDNRLFDLLLQHKQGESPTAELFSFELETLLNQRKKCLAEIKKHRNEINAEQWQEAVSRTRQILELTLSLRQDSAAQAERIVKGRKLAQTYQKSSGHHS